MRDDENATPDSPPAGPRKPGMLVIAAALVVSLGAGGFLGMGVLGPKLTAAPTAAAEHEDDEHGDSHGKKGHGKGGDSNVHSIESLVVNPAGTAGTRFLIVSVVVELDDAKTAESLKARDAAVRDLLLNVLGGKTVEQLSDVSTRDSLKAELTTAVASTLPSGKVRRLFLPQFVLQ